MKISALSLSLLVALPSYTSAASCLASLTRFNLAFRGRCRYDDVLGRIADEVAKTEACEGVTAENELIALLGVTTVEGAQGEVYSMCEGLFQAEKADEFLPFPDISEQGPQFDKQYYDGNTYWNEQYETNVENRVPYLKNEAANRLDIDAANVEDVYDGIAKSGGIQFPGGLSNFQDDDGNICDLRAVMCCWASDRQANDNNGNCAKAYDTNCVDADPGDNTDICYVDMSRSGGSAHVDAGFALYPGDNNDGEGSVHCHGFAWSQDEQHHTSRFFGNNLFFVSMYDHMSQRGYVRNIPGAPMCGCVEKMPVVTRSDCTQVDVSEVFSIDYAGTDIEFSRVPGYLKIDFNSCRGLGANNNLEEYYKRLKRDGDATAEELARLQTYIVGNGNCPSATASFVETMGFEYI
uniref:Uncharacterized protein n=1 Tax=Ditylum brightwellii TaxID=49249 RepID=A0A7S4QR51_9STRA